MQRFFAVAGMLWMALNLDAQPAEAGAATRNGQWEVSIDYGTNVWRDSVVSVANYSFPGSGATVESLRYVPLNNAVVLTVDGLLEGELYAVKVENIRDIQGEPLPDELLSFQTLPRAWAAVGGSEFGFDPVAVAIGTNGWDLISGGIQMSGNYDESTFAYEEVTGDFDKQVQVVFQEPSSIDARAGLMVREALDEEKGRPFNPFDPEQAFSRYLQVHVTPDQTAYTEGGAVVPGSDEHQVNIRAFTGGIGSPTFEGTEHPPVFNNAPPAYPDVWLRIKREGELFHVFRSSTGLNWTRLGSFTFPTEDVNETPVPPFAQKVYIGPNYSPEVANIPESSGEQRAFLAQFRNYGEGTGEVILDEPPLLEVERAGTLVEVRWEGRGTLQTSTDLIEWTSLTNSSPARITPSSKLQFFRARIP